MMLESIFLFRVTLSFIIIDGFDFHVHNALFPCWYTSNCFETFIMYIIIFKTFLVLKDPSVNLFFLVK